MTHNMTQTTATFDLSKVLTVIEKKNANNFTKVFSTKLGKFADLADNYSQIEISSQGIKLNTFQKYENQLIAKGYTKTNTQYQHLAFPNVYNDVYSIRATYNK